MQRINIFICLLLLAVIMGSSSACSLSQINAQSTNRQPETARVENTQESNATAYKPPKRVSRDIIKTDKKTAKSQTK